MIYNVYRSKTPKSDGHAKIRWSSCPKVRWFGTSMNAKVRW